MFSKKNFQGNKLLFCVNREHGQPPSAQALHLQIERVKVLVGKIHLC